MGITELKRALGQFDKKQLINIIATLYKQHKPVKEYLNFFISPDEKKLHAKYREKVSEAFFPIVGYDWSLKAGKKAISDFKKFGPSPELIADLMLFYTETGIEFTNKYGGVDEGFYYSLTSTYNASLKLLKKENLLPKFAARAYKAVTDTEGIGWYFHDNLADLYYEYYPEE